MHKQYAQIETNSTPKQHKTQVNLDTTNQYLAKSTS